MYPNVTNVPKGTLVWCSFGNIQLGNVLGHVGTFGDMDVGTL